MRTNMRKLFLLILSFAALFAAELPALGKGEKDKLPKVEASGVVRLVGNSPMTSLVISGNDREWHIDPKEEKKLFHLQQQTVTVQGSEYYVDLVFANGSSGGRQYYLKDITIVKTK